MKSVPFIEKNAQLAVDQPLNQAEVFAIFKKGYSLDEAKQKLTEWLEVALTTENLFFDDQKSREDLFKFYHSLNSLFDAIWISPE